MSNVYWGKPVANWDAPELDTDEMNVDIIYSISYVVCL